MKNNKGIVQLVVLALLVTFQVGGFVAVYMWGRHMEKRDKIIQQLDQKWEQDLEDR